jgi:enoyl-CoA hydratase/carnithine racemase
MPFEFVETSQNDGVYALTLNRPEKLNAINTQLDLDWLHALQEARSDPEVRVVLVRGNGRIFSAGHDLVEVGRIITELGDAASDWNNVFARIWPEGSPLQEMKTFPKPIITAVHGMAAGQACAAVLGSDLIVAAEGTIFNMEALRTGGAGGSAGMVGVIPPHLVNELVYMGTLNAESLRAAGVVNRVVPLDQLKEVSESMATAVARIHSESSYNFKQGMIKKLEELGVGRVDTSVGAASHGNEVDNAFWAMAAEKGVAEALRWRDEEFGKGAFATSKGRG